VTDSWALQLISRVNKTARYKLPVIIDSLKIVSERYSLT
jgi:hypothetical protein